MALMCSSFVLEPVPQVMQLQEDYQALNLVILMLVVYTQPRTL